MANIYKSYLSKFLMGDTEVSFSGTTTAPITIDCSRGNVFCTLDSVNVQNSSNADIDGINIVGSNKVTIYLKGTNTITGTARGIQSKSNVVIKSLSTKATLNITNCYTGIKNNGDLSIENINLNIISNVDQANGIMVPGSATSFKVTDSNVTIDVASQDVKITATDCINTISNSVCTFTSTENKCFTSDSTNLSTFTNSELVFDSDTSSIDIAGAITFNGTTASITSEKRHAIKATGNITVANNSNMTVTTNATFNEDLETGRFIYVPSDYEITDDWLFLSNYLGEYVKVPDDERETYTPYFKTYTLSDTSKAFNTDGSISISDSTVTCNTKDDCLNAVGDITINNSNINLTTCDDAITTTGDVLINNTASNTLNIYKSFEAIEGYKVQIAGGNNNVRSFDDSLICAIPETGVKSYEPGIYINGGINTVISDRDDAIDSDGNLVVSAGTTIIQCPWGMLTMPIYVDQYNFLINNSATFIYCANGKSWNIPALASEQNTIVADLKNITTLRKNKYVSFVHDNISYTIKLVCDNVLNETTSYMEQTGYYKLVNSAGYQIIFSIPNIVDGNWKVYVSDTFNGQLNTVLTDYDFDLSTIQIIDLGEFNFTNDSTQLYSTCMPINKVCYKTLMGTSYRYNEKFYLWYFFIRDLLQKDGTNHATENNPYIKE